MATYKVTPSGIGTLLECPRCLWLYANEGLKRPRGIFPSLPDGIDNVLKAYFDTYRAKGQLPPEIEGKVEGKLFADRSKLHDMRETNFGKGGLRGEFSEYNMLLQGAIDELLVTDDGRFIPFDFKTRGYPVKEDTHEHYRSQLNLYALLFEKNNMPAAGIGYLLFFWPKAYEKGKGEFETALIKMDINAKEGMKVLKRVHDIVTGEMPASHTDCEYCIYRNGKSNS